MTNLFSKWLSSKHKLDCFPVSLKSSTAIRFTVEASGYAKLSVFDLDGQEIATLFSGDAEPGRDYTTRVDVANLTDGDYFYKLVNNNESFVKRITLQE
jgi:hypothetical protein